MAGRPHAYDIELASIPFKVVRENGTPQWSVESVPEVAGKTVMVAEEERRWESFHGGFGYSHRLYPHTTHYCINFDTRFSRQGVMGPLSTSITFGGSANVSSFYERGTSLYALGGRYCKKIDTSTDLAATIDGGDGTTGKDFGANTVATVGVYFDSSIVVFFSSDTSVWVQASNGAWTQATTNTIKGTYGTTFWSDQAADYVLARTYVNSSAPSINWLAQGGTVDSTNWAPSTPYGVGENTWGITALASSQRMPWVGKKDGLWYVDQSGRSVQVLRVTPNDNNGVNMIVDSGGRVWYPSIDGLYRYDPRSGEVWDVSPGRGLPNASPIYGRCTALAEHKGWIYAWIYNGTDSYLMCCRERQGEEPGVGPVIWYGALRKEASATVAAAFVTSLTSPPRLYYGVGAEIAYVRLPTNGDNPLLDSGYRYAASGSLYLPTDDWGIPGTTWQATGWVIENEGFSSATYCDLFAAINHGEYQLVDSVKVAGQGRADIPQDGDWRFGRVALRLDFTNGATTTTPKLRTLVGWAARRVRVRDLISTTVYCSDRVVSNTKIPTRLSGQEMIDALKNLQEGGPATLVDYWTGSPRERRVLVMPVRERLVIQKGDEAVDQAALVPMAVLTDDRESVEQVVNPARYGTGAYGTGRYS